MKLIARVPCSFGGKNFFIGEEIPSDLVLEPKRQESRGVLAIANDSTAETGTAAKAKKAVRGGKTKASGDE